MRLPFVDGVMIQRACVRACMHDARIKYNIFISKLLVLPKIAARSIYVYAISIINHSAVFSCPLLFKTLRK
jgi:hypothetical protein